MSEQLEAGVCEVRIRLRTPLATRLAGSAPRLLPLRLRAASLSSSSPPASAPWLHEQNTAVAALSDDIQPYHQACVARTG